MSNPEINAFLEKHLPVLPNVPSIEDLKNSNSSAYQSLKQILLNRLVEICLDQQDIINQIEFKDMNLLDLITMNAVGNLVNGKKHCYTNATISQWILINPSNPTTREDITNADRLTIQEIQRLPEKHKFYLYHITFLKDYFDRIHSLLKYNEIERFTRAQYYNATDNNIANIFEADEYLKDLLDYSSELSENINKYFDRINHCLTSINQMFKFPTLLRTPSEVNLVMYPDNYKFMRSQNHLNNLNHHFEENPVHFIYMCLIQDEENFKTFYLPFIGILYQKILQANAFYEKLNSKEILTLESYVIKCLDWIEMLLEKLEIASNLSKKLKDRFMTIYINQQDSKFNSETSSLNGGKKKTKKKNKMKRSLNNKKISKKILSNKRSPKFRKSYTILKRTYKRTRSKRKANKSKHFLKK